METALDTTLSYRVHAGFIHLHTELLKARKDPQLKMSLSFIHLVSVTLCLASI